MKTTNLTFLEAIEAMERGKCVRYGPHGWIYRISGSALQLWDLEWRDASFLAAKARYFTVPDPSQPELKKSEGLREQFHRHCAYSGVSLRAEQAIEIYGDYILARVREEQGK